MWNFGCIWHLAVGWSPNAKTESWESSQWAAKECPENRDWNEPSEVKHQLLTICLVRNANSRYLFNPFKPKGKCIGFCSHGKKRHWWPLGEKDLMSEPFKSTFSSLPSLSLHRGFLLSGCPLTWSQSLRTLGLDCLTSSLERMPVMREFQETSYWVMSPCASSPGQGLSMISPAASGANCLVRTRIGSRVRVTAIMPKQGQFSQVKRPQLSKEEGKVQCGIFPALSKAQKTDTTPLSVLV